MRGMGVTGVLAKNLIWSAFLDSKSSQTHVWIRS